MISLKKKNEYYQDQENEKPLNKRIYNLNLKHKHMMLFIPKKKCFFEKMEFSFFGNWIFKFF